MLCHDAQRQMLDVCRLKVELDTCLDIYKYHHANNNYNVKKQNKVIYVVIMANYGQQLLCLLQ